MGLKEVKKTLDQQGGYEIVVAVIDSGGDFNNPYLTGRILGGTDCTGSLYGVQDTTGHGTKVASVIVCSTPEYVKVLPVKVKNDKGLSTFLAVQTGMEYAIAHGVDIINLSLGVPVGGWLDTQIEQAEAAGIVVVAATGNEGLPRNGSIPYNYPARHSKTVAVGSVNRDKEWSDFSNYGDFVDFAAPGEMIWAPTLSGHSLTTVNGTSFSSPYVAAAFADIMCVYGHMTREEITNLVIEKYVEDLGEAGRDDLYGYGMINLSTLFAWQEESERAAAGTYINVAIAARENRPSARIHVRLPQ